MSDMGLFYILSGLEKIKLYKLLTIKFIFLRIEKKDLVSVAVVGYPA
jgi:hypothetical protein